MKGRYDIVVVGGGMAGALAAVSAGRAGKNVLLVEREKCLGGIGTSAMVSELMAVTWHKEPIYGGITQEVFDTLLGAGDAAYNFQVPMSSDPSVHVDRLRCNPESIKLVLEEKVLGAGAQLLYDAACIEAEETDSGFSLLIRSCHDTVRVSCDYLIDATGNASVAHMLAYETVKAEKANLQTSSLIFRLGNLDLKALGDAIADGSIQAVITRGFESGVLKGRIMGFAPIPNTNDATVNVTRADVDHENAEDYSGGLCLARSQIPQIITFIRENVPGCRKAALGAIAASLGVRDARRIVGEYTLTGEDILTQKPFADSVALCAYPLDVHDPHSKGVVWRDIPGVFKIPLGCMIPKGAQRLLVAGRAVSTTPEAFSSIRVMPPVMNIGEAAGCVAAYLSDKGIRLAQARIEEIHTLMERQGMRY